MDVLEQRDLIRYLAGELKKYTRELMAYQHHGFWQPMDTLREKNLLEAEWASGAARWKVWS